MTADRRDLPTGTVTFFFSDIEGSTDLWETHTEGMRAALARHDEILRTAVAANGGIVIKTTGDGVHAVFPSARNAIEAALAAQQTMTTEAWSSISPDVLRVRIGIHTGEAEERDGDYFGPAVNRAARLMAIGHGGQVLLSGVTADLVAGVGKEITFSDMGEVRLRGMTHPEHVFQLVAADLPARFPPLRTEAALAGNLPQLLTSFIGREQEKVDVIRLLSQTRLLTLTGPGGTGKTRLSLEVAGELQDAFAQGVWLVELAPLNDPAGVPRAVATLWGLRENGMAPLDQVLANYLRGKELLLILDNCEHLVAAVARLTADLLAVAPRLKILASSREGLGVPGETTYHLPTMRVPGQEIADPQAMQEYESVQLLLERAHSAQPGFALTSHNAVAVGRIVRRLDGIPLAIELAAARMKLLPPEQLAERLDDRFRLLTGGSRTALPRQQTLRALIDWSYDYLDPAEQVLMRQLSVFAGGWSLEAAEVVANLEQNSADYNILDLLANLVNKSLVIMEDEDGQARFQFLETIHQYARDRLFESGDGPSVRDRHLSYFANFVLEGVPLDSEYTHLTLWSAVGSPQTLAWATQIRVEVDNVRAALQWALQRNPELALAMAIRLPFFFLFFEGPGGEAYRWLVEARQAVEELDPVNGEAARLRETLLLQGGLWEGNLLIGEGRQAEAAERLQTIVDRSRQGAFRRLLAVALSLRSLALMFLNDPRSYDTAAEALAIIEEIGELDMQGLPLSNMLTAKLQQGDLEAARALKERVRMQMKNSPSSFINGLQATTMARFTALDGEVEEAEELLKLARTQFDELGTRHFRTMAESEIGHLRRRNGDDAGAEAAYRRTIREFQDLGHRPAVANQLETFAFIAIHRGQYVRAANLLGAAEALRGQVHVEMLPQEKVEYKLELDVLRNNLEPDALEEAWGAGSKMDMDMAVTFALST